MWSPYKFLFFKDFPFCLFEFSIGGQIFSIVDIVHLSNLSTSEKNNHKFNFYVQQVLIQSFLSSRQTTSKRPTLSNYLAVIGRSENRWIYTFPQGVGTKWERKQIRRGVELRSPIPFLSALNLTLGVPLFVMVSLTEHAYWHFLLEANLAQIYSAPTNRSIDKDRQ